jgi:DNA polymerase-3 subunit delta
MTILLFGPDTYRLRQKLQEIVENYKKIHKSGLNLKFFDGKELSFEGFQDEISSCPMFAEKKLFLVKDVFQNSEFKEKFLKNSKKIGNFPDLILFHEEREIPESDSFLKTLKKTGKIQKFEFLGGRNLINWINKEAERREAEFSSQAIEKLINFVGSDSWRLSNEILKLASYKKGEEIQARDVELLVKPEIENDIFKTIDAIALGNKKKALCLFHKHLENGDSSLYLLSMINFQFRNLLMVRELIEKNQPYYSILKKTQLNPFVVKKSYQQAQRFNLQELKKIYRKIFQADLDIKTGKTEPETALDLFIAEI